MTDYEKSKVRQALNAVANAIREIEKRTNSKILEDYYTATVSNREIACFVGYNGIDYDIPCKLFIDIPQKRIVIEVARALTIDTNDYGMDI